MLARFIDRIPLTAEDRVLLFFASPIQIVRQIAARAAETVVHEVDFAARERLRAERIQRLLIADRVFPDSPERFDHALIVSPKGRTYARALLWSAYQSLNPGGIVYMIGASAEGIKSLIADSATLFDHSRTVDYKQRQRLGAATKGRDDRAWPEAWGDLPGKIQQRSFETALGPVQVGTMPGIFSWQSLDAGTALLLEQTALHEAAQDACLLDLGCGNGIIGCALSHLAREVHLCDVNLLAVECAAYSASLSVADNIQIYPADVYAGIQTSNFDLIVSNPPFHKGFDTTADIARRIISGASEYLREGGQLILVANAFLPYEAAMEQYPGSVQILAQTSRFKVLAARL